MLGRAIGSAAASKKQVRFARPLQQLREEEEETLCDNRTCSGAGAEPDTKVNRGGRCCNTALLCAAFLGLGMGIAVLGPTFKELAINVNRNLSDISYILVGRSLGYAGGSLVGGLLFDCTDHYLLIGISMLMTALGLYIIPWCTKTLLLMALMSLIGISMGMLDTGGQELEWTGWTGYLKQAGPVLLKQHVRLCKMDPLVETVQLLHANPNYAYVQFPDGRKDTESL